MCVGKPFGSAYASKLLPPIDTGEALGLASARLTITFGFGPSLFEHEGADRFGLASCRPRVLTDIPTIPGDELQPERSGGDLCVQACSNDAMVAFHAIHVLSNLASGVAVLRWTQLGFGRTASTSQSQQTPRDLFGFKDGTNNLKEDSVSLDRYVWAPPDSNPEWMRGGSYMVVRRIRMLLGPWERSTLEEQERTIGRTKISGAPLGVHRSSTR